MSILHSGEECPVDGKTVVTVKLRNGTCTRPTRANFWTHGLHDWWKWEGPADRNIIEYRVHPDQRVKEARNAS